MSTALPPFHRVVLGVLLVLPYALLSGSQAPSVEPPAIEKLVRLTAADAARIAKETRQKVSVEMPPGLELSLWASEQLVTDPVAIDLDDRGTVYVTSSSRNNMPLDIRQHPTWFTPAHMLRTTEDLREFYRREMGPERSKENTWIEDLNNDGSRDWRDMAAYKERVHRIQDTDGDGLADESRILLEGFNDDPTWDIAGGILHHQGDLIVGVPPGVYRLRDENGDGIPERRVPISEGYNIHPAFGGHGISGVTMGPDGRIYWEVGDIGFNVADNTGRRWVYPNQGAVLRSNPDGSDFEVFATGIRNLQEFSFDEHGNLISVDNDGDHQGEFERLVYIPEGSDSGWRSNWQYGKYTDPKNNRYNVWMDEEMFKPRFDGQAAHIIPPVAPYHAGPSGMAYNPGTALSEEWRRHFFVSSFPGAPSNARIYAFTLKEDGAGFALESDKVLLRGILTVGMKIGPDGALYLTDWVTGWDSKNTGRLWKLDTPAAAGSATRKEVQSLLVADIGTRTAADVATWLAHADMRVRQKAQFELVRRSDVQTLRAAAGDAGHRLSRIHAIWGMAQLARKDAWHASGLLPLLKDGDSEIRAQAAKMLGDIRHAPAGDALAPLLEDNAPRVRFFAAEALGRLAHKAAIGAIVEMLAVNDDRDLYLRHAGSVALARIGDAPAIAPLAAHPSRGVRLAALVALRRLRHPDVARFLSDADERIVTEAARAINDDGSIEAAIPALAATLGEKRVSTEPFLRRAINANLRVGTPDALNRLAAFAAETGRTSDLRAEAIRVLGVWAAPSPLDRVDGMYIAPLPPAASVAEAAAALAASDARPNAAASPQRDPAPARAALMTLVGTLGTTDSDAAIKVALADAAGRLQVTEATPVLLTQVKSDASPQVRLAALRALQALKAPGLGDVMNTALGDADPAVRRAALGILPTLPLSDAAKVQHLEAIIESGSVPEQQAAFEVLGGLKTTIARQALGSFLDRLAAGTLAPQVQIDLVDAVQTSGSALLLARLEAYQKARAADSLVIAFRGALLAGGDSRRGREVFTDNAAAQCSRCHALRGRGADVGPGLSSIGRTLSREQLLEALLEPNARIAPGFGTVSIKLRNGQQVDGTLREETDTHVVLIAGTQQRIAKTDIADRTNPVSAMPPVGLLLKPREIRDLVEFLSTLR
jgi:putative membrane-bound dehydrogenase-like protein